MVGMGTQKVSVTLDEETLRRARRRVGPRGLSSYLDDALAEKLARDERRATILEYLDELETADPSSEEDKREAAAQVERILKALGS